MVRRHRYRPGYSRVAAGLLCVSLILTACPAAAVERSRTAVASFKRQQPCPATGQAHGACPGYVLDHVEALCAGGADSPSNMQWQTAAEAKAKDKTEWAQCRSMKKR